MVKVSFLTHIIKLNTSVKYVRYLYISWNYTNALESSKLRNTRTILNDSSFKLCNVSKFSTTDTFLKSKDRYKGKKAVHVDTSEIDGLINADCMKSQFEGAIEKFEDYIMKHVSLRTRIGAVEELIITFENEDYKLEEIVQINRKPTMVVLDVSAFPQMLPNILDTLRSSQMNLNPLQEGTTIYVSLPKVTKDYRESLAKVAKQHFVKCKDVISDVRNQHIRELKRKTNVPKDLMFRTENYIGTMQKEYVQKAEQILKTKQKELLSDK